jgi:hypothetical protein
MRKAITKKDKKGKKYITIGFILSEKKHLKT